VKVLRHAVCLCVRYISLGGEGNVLYPVLSIVFFSCTVMYFCIYLHFVANKGYFVRLLVWLIKGLQWP